MNNNPSKLQFKKYITINTFNSQVILNLREEVSQTDYTAVMDVSANADPNANYNIFIDLITKAINKHFPTKRVKFYKRKHKQCDWITTGIINSITYRDKLHYKLKRSKFHDENYLMLKNNLKEYNQKIK